MGFLSHGMAGLVQAHNIALSGLGSKVNEFKSPRVVTPIVVNIEGGSRYRYHVRPPNDVSSCRFKQVIRKVYCRVSS